MRCAIGIFNISNSWFFVSYKGCNSLIQYSTERLQFARKIRTNNLFSCNVEDLCVQKLRSFYTMYLTHSSCIVKGHLMGIYDKTIVLYAY